MRTIPVEFEKVQINDIHNAKSIQELKEMAFNHVWFRICDLIPARENDEVLLGFIREIFAKSDELLNKEQRRLAVGE